MPLEAYPFAPNLALENHERHNYHWFDEHSYFYEIATDCDYTPSRPLSMATFRFRVNMTMQPTFKCTSWGGFVQLHAAIDHRPCGAQSFCAPRVGAELCSAAGFGHVMNVSEVLGIEFITRGLAMLLHT